MDKEEDKTTAAFEEEEEVEEYDVDAVDFDREERKVVVVIVIFASSPTRMPAFFIHIVILSFIFLSFAIKRVLVAVSTKKKRLITVLFALLRLSYVSSPR